METSILAHLRECIDSREGSLKALADQSGVPYHTLTKIAGGRTIPRLDTAEKILRCFPSYGVLLERLHSVAPVGGPSMEIGQRLCR